jgi:hypothetical protein
MLYYSVIVPFSSKARKIVVPKSKKKEKERKSFLVFFL